ncbi:hypothetical protein E1B28_004379 [Marasmius oreades]|uniref:Uncharacterized protein n=1 Tax=Marasmius oreades TaxID=181124 RepID=A0A9P7UYE7_9AGAR|nr:uncharacterized protein E1B28_004379 [Marasmius oreades]KAG7096984.1 hypothetical protein E1B28_004379 [Marasmius oreades]
MISLRRLLSLSFPTVAFSSSILFPQSAQVAFTRDAQRVPVQLGVMSQCPDALLCENVFDEVLKKVSDKVNFSLVYIANIDLSEPDFGVTCKHGPGECAGNVQQLCVKKYSEFSQWWEFVNCNNFQGRSKVGLPETAFKCAKVAGLDWDGNGIGKCTGPNASGTGAEGVALLKNSINLGKQMGLTISCTVVINNQKVCIHDRTWKECENGHTANDFIRQINEEYDKLNN